VAIQCPSGQIVSPEDEAVLALLAQVGSRALESAAVEERLRHVSRMEAMAQVAGGVAHDFNNLLTIIVGYTDLLRRRAPGDPETTDLCQTISSAANRAAVLTGQLLTISRRHVSEPAISDITAVVGGLGDVLGRLLGSGIDVQLQVEEGSGSVPVDAGRLEQVILDLALNARDAMRLGGQFEVTVARSVADDEPAVMLRIRDTGTGMDQETRRRCFEPYFTTKGGSPGAGLGLATVRGFIEDAHGTIGVESEPGVGTCFTIRLPAAGDPGPAPEGTAADAEIRPVVSTILLVDDDAQIRRLGREILERDGYYLIEAASAEEALDCLSQLGDGIDLLLTDVVMPGMRGKELVDRARDRLPELPVLYLSGYTDGADIPGGSSDRQTAYLGKPFRSAELRRGVRQLLDLSAARTDTPPLGPS
jgi:CheY-like chemotaxis protein